LQSNTQVNSENGRCKKGRNTAKEMVADILKYKEPGPLYVERSIFIIQKK
jgi:hypothetical protein